MVKPIRATRRERGQAIVLIALLAIILVTATGLVLDGAQTFENRRWMQNAADAGALAGAHGLSNGKTDSSIHAVIQSIARANGEASFVGYYLTEPSQTTSTAIVGSAPGHPTAADSCVGVTAYVTYPTYFMGVIGFDELTTSAQATACSGPLISTAGPLWPMLVHTPSITAPISYGSVVTLWNDKGTDYQSGTFGWADFLGNSNPTGETENWLVNPYGGPFDVFANGNCLDNTVINVPMVSVGDWLNGGPGTGMTPQLEAAIRAKIGVTVTVLYYDNSQCSGNDSRYRVVGFASLYVVDVDRQGNNGWVLGRFDRWVLPGEICVINCSTLTGLKGVVLRR